METMICTQTTAGTSAYRSSYASAPMVASYAGFMASADVAANRMPRRHNLSVATPWCADLAVAGLTAGKTCAAAPKATALTAAALGTAAAKTSVKTSIKTIAKKRPSGRGGAPLG